MSNPTQSTAGSQQAQQTADLGRKGDTQRKTDRYGNQRSWQQNQGGQSRGYPNNERQDGGGQRLRRFREENKQQGWNKGNQGGKGWQDGKKWKNQQQGGQQKSYAGIAGGAPPAQSRMAGSSNVQQQSIPTQGQLYAQPYPAQFIPQNLGAPPPGWTQVRHQGNFVQQNIPTYISQGVPVYNTYEPLQTDMETA